MNISSGMKIKQISVIIVSIMCVYFIFSKAITPSLYSHNTSLSKLPNVVIITLNGVRNSESIDNPTHQYIPHLWNEMFKEGTLYTNLVNLNNAFHMPAIQAVITGKVYPATGSLSAPTIFQYVGRKYDMPITKVWSVGDWHVGNCKADRSVKYPCYLTTFFSISNNIDKTLLLSQQEKVFLERYNRMNKTTGSGNWPIWDSLCIIEHQICKRIFKEFKPKLIYYVMGDPETAHYGTFARYVLALKSADKKIADIWQIIRRDPYYKNNTYLIVSVDNGRDPYYMQHNNTKDEIWMYIYGPNIKKGAVIKRVIHNVDIFATIAHIMNVETHPTKGKVLKDCFLLYCSPLTDR